MPEPTRSTGPDTAERPPIDGGADGFEAQLRDRVRDVRGALTELFVSVGADPERPQVVSRSFGINRNLAWKLSRIIAAEEPLAVVEHLPKASAAEIMLRAFATAGAPETAVARVRGTMESFDDAVEEHLGDRGLLELIVGPMLPAHMQVERDRAARRLAFRGNSAIWGIQAAARMSAMIMTPNAEDASMIDVATLGGLVDYRRLRSGIRWPLLRLHGYRAGVAVDTRHEPLDPELARGSAPLLRDFCSDGQPPIIEQSFDGGVQYELPEGPVGNRGLATTVFGVVTRRFASCWADEKDRSGAHLVHWFTPVEYGVSDLVVHRDLPLEMPPSFTVSGRMTPRSWDPETDHDAESIPMAEPVVGLGSGPPQFATAIVPQQRAMLEFAIERLGHDPREFEAWRVVVPHPPVPSTGMIRFPLGVRSETR